MNSKLELFNNALKDIENLIDEDKIILNINKKRFGIKQDKNILAKKIIENEDRDYGRFIDYNMAFLLNSISVFLKLRKDFCSDEFKNLLIEGEIFNLDEIKIDDENKNIFEYLNIEKDKEEFQEEYIDNLVEILKKLINKRTTSLKHTSLLMEKNGNILEEIKYDKLSYNDGEENIESIRFNIKASEKEEPFIFEVLKDDIGILINDLKKIK